jgi:hypothetical protein
MGYSAVFGYDLWAIFSVAHVNVVFSLIPRGPILVAAVAGPVNIQTDGLR